MMVVVVVVVLLVVGLRMLWRGSLRACVGYSMSVVLILLILAYSCLCSLSQLFALHTPVLEPDLDLSLCELEFAGDLPALLTSDVR